MNYDSAGETLGWIGYNLGKWIYLLDAYDDIEDNIKVAHITQ